MPKPIKNEPIPITRVFERNLLKNFPNIFF